MPKLSADTVSAVERLLVGVAGAFLVILGALKGDPSELATGLGILGVQGGAFAARAAS